MSSTNDTLVPDFRILVEGTELSVDLKSAVNRVDVDLPTGGPGRFEISISDPDLALFDDKQLDFGKKIDIELGYAGKLKKILSGEITQRSMDMRRSASPQLIIAGGDPLIRLIRKYNTRSFLEMKSSDIIKTLGSDHGLSVSCDDTGAAEPYILQNNQSDFDFLAELADAAGLEFVVTDGKLKCAKPDYKQTPVVTLRWEQDLLAFRPRFSSASAASKIEVVGWDPKAKKPIRATATPESASGGAKSTVDASGDLARVTQVSANVTSHAEAEMLAKSLTARGLARGVTALCESNGLPDLRPHAIVTLEGIGKGLTGNYMVTSAKHRMGPRGYMTFFEVRRSQFKPEETPPPEAETEETKTETVDIEVLVIDALDEALPNTDYTITLADGAKRQGKTDSDGNLKETSVPKGNFTIEVADYNISIKGRA